jgi:hypothetical protein
MLMNMQFHVMTFRPMLAALHFLALPVSFPSIAEASLKYLGMNADIRHDRESRDRLLDACRDDFAKQISSCTMPPMLSLLDDVIMDHLEKTFSYELSESMHLYGTEEVEEVVMYNKAFTQYTRHLRNGIS